MYRPLFSVVINQAIGSGTTGATAGTVTALIDIGYPRVAGQRTGPSASGTHIDKVIKSYNQAVSIAVSEARKFQSLGVAVRALIYGQVFDTGAGGKPLGNNPLYLADQQAFFTFPGELLAPANRTPPETAEYTMTVNDLSEHLYGDIDPVAHGLVQRYHLANHSTASGLSVVLDPNTVPDVDGAANIAIEP